MEQNFDTVIRISSENAAVVVEQRKKNGVIARKSISPDTLSTCFLTSRYDDERHSTGFLPENCIAMVMTQKYHVYYIRYPELHADMTYFGTEYLRFPIPRLVFAIKYLPEAGKVSDCRVCVVEDTCPTEDTKLYTYPFSNVSFNGDICLGNNALPIYKNPSRLSGLPGYILRLPNNDDRYSSGDNRLNWEYRELLEQMKNKPASYYYTDILKESSRTLKDFMKWR